MRRTRYRFLGRFGDDYIWQATTQPPGESRVEQVKVNVDWFWSTSRRS